MSQQITVSENRLQLCVLCGPVVVRILSTRLVEKVDKTFAPHEHFCPHCLKRRDTRLKMSNPSARDECRAVPERVMVHRSLTLSKDRTWPGSVAADDLTLATMVCGDACLRSIRRRGL